jgi:hypothetical protein
MKLFPEDLGYLALDPSRGLAVIEGVRFRYIIFGNDIRTVKQIAEKDGSVGIRFEMTFALTRDDKPDPEAIRKSLSSYDVKRMHSTRYGKAAPDFALADTTGKVWRLRDLRDKKSVVLVFLAGTT